MKRIAVALFFVLISGNSWAENVSRTHPINARDYFSLSVLTDVAVSPNGKFSAYVDLRWEIETRTRNGDIWVVNRDNKQARRITFDTGYDGNIRWSPDSRWIYFTSARKRSGETKAPYNGRKQVWRIGADGRNLQPVTRLHKGVISFELSANGNTVYYTTKKNYVSKEFKSLRNRYRKIEYGHGSHIYHRIYALDVRTWRSRKVVDRNRNIVGFAVSPDEQRIAMVTRPTKHLISHEGWSTVDIYFVNSDELKTLEDKQWRSEAPSPYGWLDGPTWSQDGKALAFTVSFDGYPTELFVATNTTGDIAIQKLKRPLEVHPMGGSMRFRGNSKDLIFSADHRGRTHLYLIEDAGGKSPKAGYAITSGDHMVGRYSTTKNGKQVAFVMSSPTTFGDLYDAKIKKDNRSFRQLTRTNPQTATWKLPKLSIVKWKSKDGTLVEGILELPPSYDGKKPLPMITYIHGGPASASRFRLRYWSYGRTLMAAKGYAVFAPNYRGSTGYGDKFMTDLIGRKNDIDVIDILSGVDAMVEKGIADKDRLGVMGWSNGGYLTNCIITKTNRFKAASSGAGVFDVAMQWSIEDTPGHVINYQKGLPWTNLDSMRRASPLFSANKITTPTIIHVGENDPRCPQEHSRALYRALKHYIKVPVELLVYPGEGHSLSKYIHREAHMAWDLSWFKKYLPVKPKKKTSQPPQ